MWSLFESKNRGLHVRLHIIENEKVLLINSCQGLYGGIESFLLNIFNSLSPEEFDVTFLTCGKTTYDMYRNDIENRGGHIDEIPILQIPYLNK